MHNLLVAQSGGPTSAINATLSGVITEAMIQGGIDRIYGGLNGIEGILQEKIIDLLDYINNTMDLDKLAQTPAAALGSCRFKLNRELLAAKTGCSLRTIHRLMKELEEKELIGLTGGRVNVTHGQLTRLLKLLDAPL